MVHYVCTCDVYIAIMLLYCMLLTMYIYTYTGVEEVVDMRGGWADPDLWK